MSKTASRVLIGGGVLLALVVVAALVFLNQLGRLIEHGVETAGPKMTGTDVSLGSARVSVWSGEGALRKLEIGNPDGFTTGEAFDLGRIEVKIDPKSVAGDVIRIHSIVIDGPKLVAEFDPSGRSNLKTILDNVKAAAARGGAAKKGEDDGTQTKLIVEDFKFLNAEVRALAPAYELDKTLKLRAVELKNLGARQGGAAAADIANQALRPIVDAAVQAAMQEYLAKQREKLGRKAEEKLMEKIFR